MISSTINSSVLRYKSENGIIKTFAQEEGRLIELIQVINKI